MPKTEDAPRKRATAEDKARAKRIERLAMRLEIAADLIGSVWKDADYNLPLDFLRDDEHGLRAHADIVRDSAYTSEGR